MVTLPEQPGPLPGRGLALAGVVAELAGVVDLDGLGAIVTASAASVLGADVAAVYALEAGDLRMIGLRSDARPTGEWVHLPLDADNPISEAARCRRPVMATTTAGIHRRWAGTFPAERGARSLITLPLLTGERCVGVVGLSFPFAQEFDESARQYLGVLADSCAQAIQRLTATAAALDAARKLSFLADASDALAASLDYESTLRTVADLAVPELADWCAIDLLEEGRFRRVAISHVDPAKVELAHRLWELYPPDMEAPTGAPAVARTGVSELVEAVDPELLDRLGLDEELRRLVRELELTSGLTVALSARGRTLGVLTLVSAESGRHYHPSDVRFAEDLARRAAIAIDNSHLHSETLQVALQLQQAVLPDTFAETGIWQVAVHYRPAGRTEVGGDFYDALILEEHRMVAVVGDVMGRGVEAAAAMAQVRAALRAYLAEDPEPLSVIRRLDRMFTRLDVSQLVTVVYAVVDIDAGRVDLVSAGHLPPLVIRGTGGVETLDLPASPPLGTGLPERRSRSFPFAAADTLLLFTDGLVERRGEDLDDGLRRLADASSSLLSGRLSDAALASLADRLRQTGHDDDVTLLAVRPKVPAGR